MERRPKCMALVIGAPGAGKGTFANKFAQRMLEAGLVCPHVSTGDLLRRREFGDHPYAQELIRLLNEGKLVPDEWMYGILERRLLRDDVRLACLIDGMPRTAAQAKWMLERFRPAIVFHVVTPDEIVVKRISGRLIHPASGRIYNEHFEKMRPKQSMIDDETGDELKRRPEDAESIVRERLKIYYEQTVPALKVLRVAADRKGGPVILRIDGEEDTDTVVGRMIHWVTDRVRV